MLLEYGDPAVEFENIDDGFVVSWVVSDTLLGLVYSISGVGIIFNTIPQYPKRACSINCVV